MESTHHTPILKSSHWLPVVFHTDHKILLLVERVLHDLAPDHLSEVLLVSEPERPADPRVLLFLLFHEAEQKHVTLLPAIILQAAGTAFQRI